MKFKETVQEGNRWNALQHIQQAENFAVRFLKFEKPIDRSIKAL